MDRMSIAREFRARAAVAALLIGLAGSGCSLLDLRQQLVEAHQTLVRFDGELTADSLPQETLVALLGAGGKLQAYSVVGPGSAFRFTLARGDYQLLACIDRNGNFVLDPAEPRQWLRPVRGAALTEGEPEPVPQLAIRLHADELQPAPPLDLSLARLYRDNPQLRRNYRQQVDFDDPRFSPERVSQGAWKPLDFMREVGYGLYLLQPWDAKKEPVFLVHGINDSPRAWRELIASLDPQRFQPVLFYYPSGVALSNSAYLLSEADPRRATAPLASTLPCGRPQQGRPGGAPRGTAAQRRRRQSPVPVPHPVDAAKGVERAPVVAPAWRDLAPGSRYLQDLFAAPLPAHIRQWQLVSYAGNRRLLPQPNDGVVPLASELFPAAQDVAEHLYLLRESHVSILRSARSQELIEPAQGSLPAKGCRAQVSHREFSPIAGGSAPRNIGTARRPL